MVGVQEPPLVLYWYVAPASIPDRVTVAELSFVNPVGAPLALTGEGGIESIFQVRDVDATFPAVSLAWTSTIWEPSVRVLRLMNEPGKSFQPPPSRRYEKVAVLLA